MAPLKAIAEVSEHSASSSSEEAPISHEEYTQFSKASPSLFGRESTQRKTTGLTSLFNHLANIDDKGYKND